MLENKSLNEARFGLSSCDFLQDALMPSFFLFVFLRSRLSLAIERA